MRPKRKQDIFLEFVFSTGMQSLILAAFMSICILAAVLSLIDDDTVSADTAKNMRQNIDEKEYSLEPMDKPIKLATSQENIENTTNHCMEEIETKILMDVPLEDDLQLFIIDYCEERHISPALVMAMIERESRYTADTVGDNGNSLGLMQIQPRFHQERMQRLGCTDLLDPYQNVMVGIDILAELSESYGTCEAVLMAYNGGPGYASKMISKGQIREYARYVIDRASELGKGVY